MTYTEIQDEVINNYKIVIVSNSTCRGRTHAHSDGTRRICKWERANGVISTFTLFHEVGHIMTYKTKMRRCESEYFATIWAIKEGKKYNIDFPQKIITKYQNYIDRELARGLRRSGSNYNIKMDLFNFKENEIKELSVKEPKQKQRRVIL